MKKRRNQRTETNEQLQITNQYPIITSPTLDKSPIIPQRSKLKNLLNISTRPDLTPKQKEFISLALNKQTKLIFVDGPAGTSKTWIAVYCSLLLLNERRVSDLIYVRSAVECAEKSIGFLPGVISEKLGPYVQPLMDKLEEFLSKHEIESLKKEERISGLPIGFLRGLNWNAVSVILDEAQNTTTKELITFITRIGNFSKVFVIGDHSQSDLNGKSGFFKTLSLFDDEESKSYGIYVFKFTEDDIVRSELVKFISRKIKILT